MKGTTLLLSIFTLCFIISIPVAAQPVPTPELIPGIDCGNIGDKCCVYKPTAASVPSSITNLPGYGVYRGLVEGLFENIINPFFNPLNRIAQTTIKPCLSGEPSTPGDTTDPSCVCQVPKSAPLKALTYMCNTITDRTGKEKGDCNACIESGGVWTAVGCIFPSVTSFIQKTLLAWGIGLAGMVSILCIIYGAFAIQTSSGNPDKVKKAQELFTSCIIGLMLVIFSIFILRLIGVEILRIPGIR